LFVFGLATLAVISAIGGSITVSRTGLNRGRKHAQVASPRCVWVH
jgi:hypothetical protein